MKAGTGGQTLAAVGMLVAGLAVAYGSGPVYGKIQSAGRGTAVDISGKNGSSYQVEGVWKRSDGGYMVHARAQGFQSEILMEVVFEEGGDQIRQVKVLSQGDTEGIGSKITEAGFAAGFEGVKAPVQVKDMEVASPAGGGQSGVTAEEAAQEKPGRSDPKEWNSKDQSAQAQAVRTLYETGMLTSSLEEQPLSTAVADLSVEEQAVVHLERAGLLDGPIPETTKTSAQTAASKVDGVSGATISSKGAATAVNNAYFFLKEELGQ